MARRRPPYSPLCRKRKLMRRCRSGGGPEEQVGEFENEPLRILKWVRQRILAGDSRQNLACL